MPRHILIADGPAQPDATAIDTFWAEAQKSLPGLGEDYQVRSLGIDAATTSQILEYIKTRDKVATFSLPWVIEANGFPYSEPGTPIVLCDYVGTPHLIVQLTDVRETTFRDIGYARSPLSMAHPCRTRRYGYRSIANIGTVCWPLMGVSALTICRC